jgi:hypothetical protein
LAQQAVFPPDAQRPFSALDEKNCSQQKSRKHPAANPSERLLELKTKIDKKNRANQWRGVVNDGGPGLNKEV